MKIMKRFFIFFIVAAAVAGGCDDPVSVQPDTISGQVSLYDELGNPLSVRDQVQVAALSSSSIRQYLTYTDASGRFELELPEGESVPLLFTRDGFGDMYLYDVDDETEPIQVELFQRSSADVTAVGATAESCGTVDCLRLVLDVQNFFGDDTTRRLFRLFMSTDPGMSFWNYQVTDLLVVPNDQPGLVQDGANATFELDGVHGLLDSFPSGTRVHLRIYGATENLSNSYPQPDTGLEIFTDISDGFAKTIFVIP